MVEIPYFFFSSRRRHTRFKCDWSSDVCSSDLGSVKTEDQGKRSSWSSHCIRSQPAFLRNPPGYSDWLPALAPPKVNTAPEPQAESRREGFSDLCVALGSFTRKTKTRGPCYDRRAELEWIALRVRAGLPTWPAILALKKITSQTPTVVVPYYGTCPFGRLRPGS